MGFGNAVASALAIMRDEKNVYKDYLPPSAIKAGQQMIQNTKGLWEDVLIKVIEMVKNEIPFEYPHVAVWWYSVLIDMKKDPRIFYDFIQYIREHRNVFSLNTQYFLFYQLASLRFRYPELDGDNKELIWKYYTEIADSFSACFPNSLLEPIPEEKRNKDFILVITEQFISIQHGPTKTALDRCKAIITKLGKKVLLLNDAEVLSSVGSIPFSGALEGSYMPQKLHENVQHWKGIEIPYQQCRNDMPNIRTMENLLQMVRAMAPEKVITIGKGGIFAQLVSKIIPMLTIGLCPSDFEYTCAKYQTLSRPLTPSDLEILAHMGYCAENIIESIFTSSLKPQTEHISRSELGIPERAFLIIVVGARLDSEVTDDFLSVLENVITDEMHISFLGTFQEYGKYLNKFQNLQKHSSYLGFCNDILSRLEVCDLYVNPIRKGGGTSCVEALYKGVPVVTTNYGDVSVNAGKDFCVENYAEMADQILKYYQDKEYYQVMSEKAKKRAELLLDTDKEFIRILQEMDRREQTKTDRR